MAQHMISNLLREESLSVGDIEPFLPGYNDCHNERSSKSHSIGSRNASTVALENMTTILQTVILSNPLSFIKHLVDLASLQRCIESYLCHRYKPYERSEVLSSKSHLGNSKLQQAHNDVPSVKQSHHSLLLAKLDKLIFAFYKRLVEIYKRELPSVKKFAASSKISVFKSVQKPATTDTEETNMLQTEFRGLLNEKVRILRLPYILELVSLMGETNLSLSSMLLCDLFDMRPALKWEIGASVQESLQAVRDVNSGIIALQSSGMVSKSALSVEGSVYFVADIAHSLSLFFSAVEPKVLFESGIIHHSGQLTAKTGLQAFQIAQTVIENICPALLDTLDTCAAQTDTSQPAPPSNKKKTAIVMDTQSSLNDLYIVVQMSKLASFRLYRQLLTLSLAPLPSTISQTLSSESASSSSEVVSEESPISWFEIFSQESSPSNGLILQYLVSMPNALQQYEQLLLPTFGDEEMVYSYIKSLADHAGVQLPPHISAQITHNDSTNHLPTETVVSTAASSSAGTNSHSDSLSPALRSKIQHLKDMFPDCGAFFLEACLRFYNEEESEAIEALLTDNLHPRLASLDRTMETPPAAMGNSSGTATGGKPAKKLSANDTVDIFAQRQNPAFVAQQIAFVRQREALQAADAALLRREYDDDYDDQFDDLISKKDLAAENEYSECIYEDPRDLKAGRKREEWHRQMAETKRFNTLLREEEQEIAFWKNMEINNHASAAAKVTSATTETAAVKEEETHTPKHSKQPQSNGPHPNKPADHSSSANNHSKDQHHNNAPLKGKAGAATTAGATSDTAANADDTSDPQHNKKPRTKTFDRHHQKDKALKKMGAFRPS